MITLSQLEHLLRPIFFAKMIQISPKFIHTLHIDNPSRQRLVG